MTSAPMSRSRTNPSASPMTLVEARSSSRIFWTMMRAFGACWAMIPARKVACEDASLIGSSSRHTWSSSS
jgi:hypothetical protein